MSYHCKKCDTTNIEVKEWLNPNTGKGRDSYIDLDEESTWCKMCQEETVGGIVWKDDP